MLSERARYERDQPVQRPWGANVPGMFEEQQGDWGNWSGEVGGEHGENSIPRVGTGCRVG